MDRPQFRHEDGIRMIKKNKKTIVTSEGAVTHLHWVYKGDKRVHHDLRCPWVIAEGSSIILSAQEADQTKLQTNTTTFSRPI